MPVDAHDVQHLQWVVRGCQLSLSAAQLRDVAAPSHAGLNADGPPAHCPLPDGPVEL